MSSECGVEPPFSFDPLIRASTLHSFLITSASLTPPPFCCETEATSFHPIVSSTSRRWRFEESQRECFEDIKLHTTNCCVLISTTMDENGKDDVRTFTPSDLSPLASPIQSPPSEASTSRLRGRRRSSLVPPDSQMINLSPSKYVNNNYCQDL